MADRRGKGKAWEGDDAKQAPQSPILPTPSWEDNVAAHDEKRSASSEPREEHKIPSLSSSGYDGKPCKCDTLEAYHNGAICPFHHDEPSRPPESVAITISPTVGEQPSLRESVAITVSHTVGGGGGYGNSGRRSNWNPLTWRTRICRYWETTGGCGHGTKCHFAHGVEELQGVVSSTTSTDNVVASTTSVLHRNVYRMGVPSQKSSGVPQPSRERARQNWGKSLDKTNRIYADWIDDLMGTGSMK